MDNIISLIDEFETYFRGKTLIGFERIYFPATENHVCHTESMSMDKFYTNDEIFNLFYEKFKTINKKLYILGFFKDIKTPRYLIRYYTK